MNNDHFDVILFISCYPITILWSVFVLGSFLWLLCPSTILFHVVCIPLSINHVIHRRNNNSKLLSAEAHCIRFLSRHHLAIYRSVSALTLIFSFILWSFGYHVPLPLNWYLWYGRLLNVVHLVGYWITKGTNQMHRYQTPCARASDWMLYKIWKFWTKSHYLYHSELVCNRLRIDMNAHDETLRVLDDGLIANDDSKSSGTPIPNEIQNLIAEYAFNGHIHLMSAQRAMCRSLRALHLPTTAVHEANKLTFPERERNLLVQIRYRQGFKRESRSLIGCLDIDNAHYQPIYMRILYSDMDTRVGVLPIADFEYDLESKELIKLCAHCGLTSEDPTAVERSECAFE